MMVELTQTLLHHDLSAHMTHISIRSQASVTGNRKTPALAVNPTSNHPTSTSQAKTETIFKTKLQTNNSQSDKNPKLRNEHMAES